MKIDLSAKLNDNLIVQPDNNDTQEEILVENETETAGIQARLKAYTRVSFNDIIKKEDIVDNLDSTDPTKVLSARQGNVIKQHIINKDNPHSVTYKQVGAVPIDLRDDTSITPLEDITKEVRASSDIFVSKNSDGFRMTLEQVKSMGTKILVVDSILEDTSTLSVGDFVLVSSNKKLYIISDTVGTKTEVNLVTSAEQVTYDNTESKIEATNVQDALDELLEVAGKIDDVTINNVSIVSNKVANIATEGVYNASTNKLTTKSYVDTYGGKIDDVKVNGSSVVSNKIANITVPTKTSQLTNDSDFVSDANYVHTDNNFTSDYKSQITTNKDNILIINSKIPTEASQTNQLADKNFVNSSIATETAYFKGTLDATTDLGLTKPAEHLAIATALNSHTFEPAPTNNDYCFVINKDSSENVIYDRFKYINGDNPTWSYEYSLNNSSFTASQWAAINSGINSNLTTQITTNKDDISTINSKIPSEATSANKLADKAYVGSAIDNKIATLDSSIAAVENQAIASITIENGIITGHTKVPAVPKTSTPNKVLSSTSIEGVTSWQNPGDVAVYVESQYVGFTSVFNAENVTNKVTSISSLSTNTQYPSAKAVYDYIETKVLTLTDAEYETYMGE